MTNVPFTVGERIGPTDAVGGGVGIEIVALLPHRRLVVRVIDSTDSSLPIGFQFVLEPSDACPDLPGDRWNPLAGIDIPWYVLIVNGEEKTFMSCR